jgi:hypothetical protein
VEAIAHAGLQSQRERERACERERNNNNNNNNHNTVHAMDRGECFVIGFSFITQVPQTQAAVIMCYKYQTQHIQVCCYNNAHDVGVNVPPDCTVVLLLLLVYGASGDFTNKIF